MNQPLETLEIVGEAQPRGGAAERYNSSRGNAPSFRFYMQPDPSSTQPAYILARFEPTGREIFGNIERMLTAHGITFKKINRQKNWPMLRIEGKEMSDRLKALQVVASGKRVAFGAVKSTTVAVGGVMVTPNQGNSR